MIDHWLTSLPDAVLSSAEMIAGLRRGVSVAVDSGTEMTADVLKAVARTHPELLFLLTKVRNVTAAYKEQRLMGYWGNRRII